jgi:hypothetical protein
MFCAFGVGYLRPFCCEGIQLLTFCSEELRFAAGDTTFFSEGCYILQRGMLCFAT